jgi:CubicO group peptidase (beta-lactamase class C family)
MPDTAFNLTDTMRARLSGMHARAPEGQLTPMPFEMPQHPDFEMGGGALYGTALDYLRFMRMILNGGELDGVRVLKEETVREMLRDQCPGLGCGFMKSIAPEISHDAEFFPPEDCGWGLSFLLSRKSVPGGRKAGSVACAPCWAHSYCHFSTRKRLKCLRPSNAKSTREPRYPGPAYAR